MRIGQGYDVHKLVEGRDCIICGVKIPYEKGLLGHSDADVALHALADAILGAAFYRPNHQAKLYTCRTPHQTRACCVIRQCLSYLSRNYF